MVAVMPQLRIERGGIHYFVVNKKRIFRPHELGVAAPVGGNNRQAHQHRFVVRASPAFAATWGHQTIGRFVKAGQIGLGHLFSQDMDSRQALVPQVEGGGKLGNQSFDDRPRIAIGLAEQISAHIQADIVLRGEFAQIGGQQNIPALAAGPLEDGKEVAARAVGQG